YQPENLPISSFEIVRLHAGVESVIARMDERCGPPGSYAIDRFQFIEPYCHVFGDCTLANVGPLITFNSTNGTLFVPTRRSCQAYTSGCSYGYMNPSLFVIHGFSPLFEIFQTYTPTADALKFRVPAHPEGLRSADH